MNNIESLNTGCANDFAAYEPVGQFRAECPADADAIRSDLWPSALSYKAEVESQDDKGRTSRASNIEVGVRLRPGAPSIKELRYICDAVPNAHIAEDTMGAVEAYTCSREPQTPSTERRDASFARGAGRHAGSNDDGARVTRRAAAVSETPAGTRAVATAKRASAERLVDIRRRAREGAYGPTSGLYKVLSELAAPAEDFLGDEVPQ